MADDFSLEAPGDTGKKKKGGGLFVTLAAVLLLTLVGGGGGWMVGGLLAPEIKARTAQAAEAEAEAAGASGQAGGNGEAEEAVVRPNLVELEPITTNLSYPSDKWVRVEVALLYRGEPDQYVTDRINEDILAYLRTVSLQQIEGPRGFQYLRDDLAERARLRSEGKVTDVLFRTFVIE